MPMITTQTPYKLAEIIRDTWPQLYRLPKTEYNQVQSLNTFRNQKKI